MDPLPTTASITIAFGVSTPISDPAELAIAISAVELLNASGNIRGYIQALLHDLQEFFEDWPDVVPHRGSFIPGIAALGGRAAIDAAFYHITQQRHLFVDHLAQEGPQPEAVETEVYVEIRFKVSAVDSTIRIFPDQSYQISYSQGNLTANLELPEAQLRLTNTVAEYNRHVTLSDIEIGFTVAVSDLQYSSAEEHQNHIADCYAEMYMTVEHDLSLPDPILPQRKELQVLNAAYLKVMNKLVEIHEAQNILNLDNINHQNVLQIPQQIEFQANRFDQNAAEQQHFDQQQVVVEPVRQQFHMAEMGVAQGLALGAVGAVAVGAVAVGAVVVAGVVVAEAVAVGTAVATFNMLGLTAALAPAQMAVVAPVAVGMVEAALPAAAAALLHLTAAVVQHI